METKKTIVITGSTRGIGYGLAKEFLKYGHQLVLNGRSEESLNKCIEELKLIHPEVIGITGSVEEKETHQKLINESISSFGKIDIWINNAGIPQAHKRFIDLSSEDIKKLTEVNIYGLMLGTKMVSNQMIKQGFGKIFNMEGFGSDGRMMDKLTLYGTSKRAVNYFTKSISKEMKNSPIQIGILSPGMVRTEFLETSMAFASEEETYRFKKVYKILAEDVDVVTKFLVKKMLISSKNYDRIEFLTKGKLMVKLIKMLIK